MTKRVKVKDRGFDKLVARLAEATGALSVGIHAEQGQKEHPKAKGETVAQVASWNELGTDTIPSRPWLRGWYAENEQKVWTLLRKNLGAIVSKSMPPAQANERLQLLAEVVAKTMRDRIEDRIPPPNAELTLRQKQGDIPLIDTKTLIRSITGRYSPSVSKKARRAFAKLLGGR